jgi:hypothetical protein
MKTTFRLLLISALLLSFRSNSNAGALDTWSNKNPAGGATLREIAYGAGTFVAVGASGVIVTSTDTTNWVMQTSGSPENFNGVTYANGIFVAVGDSGALLNSTDGTNWFIIDAITGNSLYNVNYGSGQFVAVGGAGTVLTSPDGDNWTQQTTPTTNSLSGITFAGGKFVAVGGLGTILTSANGTSWTSQNSGTNSYLEAVGYGQGTFVAVGDSGVILTSANATSWSPQTSGTADDLLNITFNNGKFVIVGGSYYYDYPYGPNFTAILTSGNGTIWTAQSSPMPNILNGVCFGDGAFVAVGMQNTIMISTNGSNWGCRAFSDFAVDPGTPPVHGPSQCAFGNGTFVLGGHYTPFFTSPDGVNWSAQWPSQLLDSDSFIQHIAYVNGLFVASVYDKDVSEYFLLVSTDGATWTTTFSQSTELEEITYGNGHFVVAGNGDPSLNFFTSPNGTNWTARTLGNAAGPANIAFGNGIFVITAEIAFGSTTYTNAILTSTNGVNWKTNFVNFFTGGSGNDSQNLLSFGNGIFLFLSGSVNGILTSPDGVSWQTNSFPYGEPYSIGTVAFGNGEFILTTTTGVATSVDGVSWVNHDLTGSVLGPEQEIFGGFSWLNSLVYGNGIFVGVNGTTYGGTIVTSAALKNPQLGGGQILSNNTFQMTVTGQPSHNYAIAATTNFSSWSGLTNVISSNATINVVDPAATNFNARFYRAIEQ